MNDMLEIIKARYDSSDKKSITFTLLNKANNEEMPFGYIVGSDDQAPITLWLNELWKNGEIKPDPYIEPVVTKEERVALIRASRNTLLKNTDIFLTVPDYPLSEEQKDEIRQFRQLLRDIPLQPGFPENVIWPNIPSCIKDKINTCYETSAHNIVSK